MAQGRPAGTKRNQESLHMGQVIMKIKERASLDKVQIQSLVAGRVLKIRITAMEKATDTNYFII